MQTSFKTQFDKQIKGQVMTSGLTEKVTAIAQEAMEFGVAVKRGTVEGSAKNIAVDGTTDVVLGVTAHTHTGTATYVAGSDTVILTEGSIAVEVLSTDTVAAGDSAYMIVAETNRFKWTKTAGSNTVACGKFQSSKDSNGLAVVKIDVLS